MPYRGRGTFDTGNISFGGYFSARFQGTITLTVSDDLEDLTCKIDFGSSSSVGDGPATGGGFYNVAAVGFVQASELLTPKDYSTNWYHGEHYEMPPEASSSDAVNHMNTFLANYVKSDQLIFGCYARDDHTGIDGYFNSTHSVANKSFTHTWNNIRSTLIDEDTGQFNDFYPIYVAQRTYKWDGYPYNERESVESCVRINGLPPDMADLDWSYYPWAVKSGSTWLSCNRDDAFYRIKRSGSFADAKNTLFAGDTDTTNQHGFIKKSNTFKRMPITGVES